MRAGAPQLGFPSAVPLPIRASLLNWSRAWRGSGRAGQLWSSLRRQLSSVCLQLCQVFRRLRCPLGLQGAWAPTNLFFLTRIFYLLQESYMDPPKLCCLTPGVRHPEPPLGSIGPAFPRCRSRNRGLSGEERGVWPMLTGETEAG